MRTIFKWFIDHPKLINLFLVLVLIMGGLSFLNLKRNSMPNVDFKMMFVTTIYPGAAPEDVEVNVTIPIEEQLQEVSGIKDMESFSGENYSLVFVKIDPDVKDIEEVKSDVNKAVDRVTGLPAEILDKPLVTELKTDIFPVFEVAITGNHAVSELDLRKYAKTLEDKIRHLPGVGGTRKVGYRKREIHIEVDPVKASRHYVSLAEVMFAIRASNIRLSGGNIQSLTTKKKVITLSQFDDPLEVKDVIVRSVFSGKRIVVSEVAEVKDSFEEESILVSTNSEPCINIIISKNANADAVRVAKRVKVLLDEFNKELPQGVRSQIVKDYSVYVNAMLRTVIFNAMIGFLLVLLCLMIFLDRRIAFWTALGIPFSLLVAFYFMPFYDISITNISLLGFIIVLGMLVDDAIVVAENIYSYREKGLGPVEASVQGISEIFWPVLATVSTTIAAFLPMLLMGGIMGDFVRAVPIMITIVLLASLVESAFILPSHLAHTKLKGKGKPKLLLILEKYYRGGLLRVLKHKYLLILTFVLVFIFAIGVVLPMLGFELMHSSDEDIIMCKIQTPKGTPLRETQKRVEEIEKIIVKTVPKNLLASYVTTIGQKGTDMWDNVGSLSQGHWARIDINLIPMQQRKTKSSELEKNLKKALAGIKNGNKFTEVSITPMRGGPPTGKPIDISFVGDNDKIRTQLGDQFVNFISKQEGVFDIVRNDEEGLNELNIKLNHGLMNELGITAADVAMVIRAAITGNIVTSIRKEGEEIDFRVMLEKKYRNDANYIKSLTIPNRFGKLIKLGSFIRFEEKSSPIGIYHSDGDRVLEITAEIDRNKLNASEFNKVIKEKFTPITEKHPGFRIIFGGEEQSTKESLADFFNAMVIAVIVIYIILVVLFNSFSEPLIVMMAIPFGLAGVIFAFALHREPLGFMGLIGILGLSGVVVNNSLVMLKFLNKKEDDVCEKGEQLSLAHIADAAMLRFRPIMLTTVTTVVGLLPSLYGFFGGRIDFLFPLLLALCWGLVFSSLITLYLIPSLYIAERDINLWIARKFGRISKEEVCRLDIANY